MRARTGAVIISLITTWLGWMGGAPVWSQVDRAEKKQIHEELADFGETLKRLHHVAVELHAEVNRHPQIVTGPDMLDAALMDCWGSASPGLYPSGGGWVDTAPGPALPPRKRYLDLSIAQLNQLLPVFDADSSAINRFSQQFGHDSDLQEQASILNEACNRIDSLNSKILSLTKAPLYDSKAISNSAEDVHDEIAAINVTRQRLSKLLNRDE